MIDLIKESKFSELKAMLANSPATFAIHSFLLDVLTDKAVEIDGDSFNSKMYQEDFFEGLELFAALRKSAMPPAQLSNFSDILVKLAFKMAGFIQLLASRAMQGGVYLSQLEHIYKVNPALRSKVQDFIGLLKEDGDVKAVANIAAAKAQITNATADLLKKEDIGHDMLQFADAYAEVGQTVQAIQIYRGIFNDFAPESAMLSSGVFSEIKQVDTRTTAEIQIFETAKKRYEDLSGDTLPEFNTAHIDNDKAAQNLVEQVRQQTGQVYNTVIDEQVTLPGVWSKLKNLFKKG